VDLLAEHTGLDGDLARELARVQGLVSFLDQICVNPRYRLRGHPMLADNGDAEPWIQTFFPEGLPLDPEGPVFGEDSYEEIPAGRDSLFPRGINWLSNLLSRSIE
jgi:hypothetical protein